MGISRNRPAARRQLTLKTCSETSLPNLERLDLVAFAHERRRVVIRIKLRAKERKLIVLCEKHLFLERVSNMDCRASAGQSCSHDFNSSISPRRRLSVDESMGCI